MSPLYLPTLAPMTLGEYQPALAQRNQAGARSDRSSENVPACWLQLVQTPHSEAELAALR